MYPSVALQPETVAKGGCFSLMSLQTESLMNQPTSSQASSVVSCQQDFKKKKKVAFFHHHLCPLTVIPGLYRKKRVLRPFQFLVCTFKLPSSPQ